MRKIKLLVAAMMVATFGAFTFVTAGTANAIDPGDPLAEVCASDPSNSVCESADDDANDLIKTLVNVLLFVVGALAVIMIIIGGIRYATSAGNSANITAAKNTIMYAVIGLIVAFLAYAIVNWVVLVL